MGARKLYNLVKYLPPNAALWRVQETPAESDPLFQSVAPGETKRTSDPKEIRAFFDEHIG